MIPHGRHIYAKASDMTKAKMCTYPKSYHALPRRKVLLRCCAECPYINIPYREEKTMNKQYSQLGVTFITSLEGVLLMVEFH